MTVGPQCGAAPYTQLRWGSKISYKGDKRFRKSETQDQLDDRSATMDLYFTYLPDKTSNLKVSLPNLFGSNKVSTVQDLSEELLSQRATEDRRFGLKVTYRRTL